jgi:hypothetical protein
MAPVAVSFRLRSAGYACSVKEKQGCHPRKPCPVCKLSLRVEARPTLEHNENCSENVLISQALTELSQP